jgi:hypothetical protein
MFEDIRERIERLEREAEAVGETLESCRKTMALARAATWGGATLAACGLLGLLQMPLAALLACIGAFIGGMVFYGSNRSTLMEGEERLRAIEKERSGLIDALGLPARGMTVH